MLRGLYWISICVLFEVATSSHGSCDEYVDVPVPQPAPKLITGAKGRSLYKEQNGVQQEIDELAEEIRQLGKIATFPATYSAPAYNAVPISSAPVQRYAPGGSSEQAAPVICQRYVPVETPVEYATPPDQKKKCKASVKFCLEDMKLGGDGKCIETCEQFGRKSEKDLKKKWEGQMMVAWNPYWFSNVFTLQSTRDGLARQLTTYKKCPADWGTDDECQNEPEYEEKCVSWARTGSGCSGENWEWMLDNCKRECCYTCAAGAFAVGQEAGAAPGSQEGSNEIARPLVTLP